MARIDIEIEEYLDEVRTESLFRELRKRKDFEDYIEDYMNEDLPSYIIPDFETSEQVLNFVKRVLGLNSWHDKERIIKEIQSL